MLTQQYKLYPGMVGAKRVTLATAGELTLSRFDTIIDDNGYECGAVSDHYTLIRNQDLVAAVDLASDEIGIELECGPASYHNGRSRFSFYPPDEYRVAGDPSGIRTQIEIGNGYGGRANISGMSGAFRLICTNGMVIGQVHQAISRKHTGEISVMEVILALLTELVNQADKHQEVVRHASEISADQVRLDPVFKHTAPRYQKQLHDAIMSNTAEIGNNVWAITQAISEVATHDMPGWNATEWQRTQTNRVLVAAGLEV